MGWLKCRESFSYCSFPTAVSNVLHFGAPQIIEVWMMLKIWSRSSHPWVKRMQTVSGKHGISIGDLNWFAFVVLLQNRTTAQAKQRHQKDNILSFLRQIFQELGKHSFLCSHTDLDNETLDGFRKNRALHSCSKLVLCYCTTQCNVKLPAVVKSSVLENNHNPQAVTGFSSRYSSWDGWSWRRVADGKKKKGKKRSRSNKEHKEVRKAGSLIFFKDLIIIIKIMWYLAAQYSGVFFSTQRRVQDKVKKKMLSC